MIRDRNRRHEVEVNENQNLLTIIFLCFLLCWCQILPQRDSRFPRHFGEGPQGTESPQDLGWTSARHAEPAARQHLEYWSNHFCKLNLKMFLRRFQGHSIKTGVIRWPGNPWKCIACCYGLSSSLLNASAICSDATKKLFAPTNLGWWEQSESEHQKSVLWAM